MFSWHYITIPSDSELFEALKRQVRTDVGEELVEALVQDFSMDQHTLILRTNKTGLTKGYAAFTELDELERKVYDNLSDERGNVKWDSPEVVAFCDSFTFDAEEWIREWLEDIGVEFSYDHLLEID